ncbi:MarR family winged helix-turn-helix transcriptional regulator [Streptosporangium lutulentum]
MSVETELAELVHGVGHRLRRGYGEQLGPLGMSPGQARALRVIVGSESPLKMVQLAERLKIVPRSVTSVVDALEEAAWFAARSTRRAVVPPCWWRPPRAAHGTNGCARPGGERRGSCSPYSPPSSRISSKSC